MIFFGGETNQWWPLNVHVLETGKHLYPFDYYVLYKHANAEKAINIKYFQKNKDSLHDVKEEGHIMFGWRICPEHCLNQPTKSAKDTSVYDAIYHMIQERN